MASAPAVIWWVALTVIVIVVVTVFLPIDFIDKLHFSVALLLVGFIVTLSVGSLLHNRGLNAARSQMRTMISEHYQVEYPRSVPIPGRGDSVKASLEGKNDGTGVLKVYEGAIIKRSVNDIVTLWVPKEEGSTEFVELDPGVGASEYVAKG